MSFAVETDADHDLVIVHIGKALDFRNASAFKTKCQSHVERGARHFILDFSGTGILDSTALGAVFSIYRQISPMDGHMVFAGTSGAVAQVIEMTKLDRVFSQFATVEAAKAFITT